MLVCKNNTATIYMQYFAIDFNTIAVDFFLQFIISVCSIAEQRKIKIRKYKTYLQLKLKTSFFEVMKESSIA